MILITVDPGNRRIVIRQLGRGLEGDRWLRADDPMKAMDLLQGLIDNEVDHPERYV